ncbi:MAG: hypothetical protein ABI478_14340, partial [Propionivibrio sp.]
KRSIAKDVSGNPVSAAIAGTTLGLMSGFVPGAPDGSDLPQSMQESYRMFSFASKNATAIVEGLQGLKSIPPASGPPQMATAGAAVASPGTLAIPAVTVDSVHMAVSAASASGYEPGNRHPATDKEVLGKLERPDRSSATAQPGNPKLDELVMAAKPSAKLDPPPVVTLENSGRHDPSSLSYASDKSVMPAVEKQVDLFNKSVALPSNGQTIPARVAADEAGNVHQFHASGPNNYHWAGQQGGVTKTGEPVPIDPSKLSYFQRLLQVLGE